MLPLVAIVGRPNVGKSTLFNRLVRRKSALVADEPGLTRDRHYGQAEWEGRSFDLVDTGGFEVDAEHGAIEALIRAQTEMAMDEAHLVVLVGDARDGLTAADEELALLLRRAGKPTLVVANKVDGPKQEAFGAEFHQLGFESVFPISAEHGLGMDDLIDAILAGIPHEESSAPSEVIAESTDQERPLRIALVGRPNAGKSALLNRLAGKERSIVSEVPGTTRDPVDVELEAAGGRFVVVDTAGIRRKRRSGPLMEQISVIRALRAVNDADVACLLIDSSGEISTQEARIANVALDSGRGLVLVFSKSDLGESLSALKKKIAQQVDDKLHFVDFAPQLILSAKTGKGVSRLLPQVRRVYDEARRRIPTAELNRFLEATVQAHGPAAFRGRQVRLLYITQADVAPPTFIVSVNYKEGVLPDYRRYMQNRLREQYRFEGVPLRVFYRERSRSQRKG